MGKTKKGDRASLGAAAAEAAGSTGGTAGGYGSVHGDLETAAGNAGAWLRKTAHWLEHSEDTDPALLFAKCCDCEQDFRSRRLKAPVVLAWVFMQVVGLLFQGQMVAEIGQHLETFDQALAANCGPEHLQEGVCLGPTWNLTSSQVLEFPPSLAAEDQREFDFVIPPDRSISFETASMPPTFLIGVEPLPPHESLGWKLALSEQGSTLGGAMQPTYGHGKKYKATGKKTACSRPTLLGRCQWSGSLTLTSKGFTDSVSVHVYVVDSRIAHLEDIHKQPQCSFEQSWQNFNERHNGSHHQVLTNAWRCSAFFLLVSLACTGTMLRRFFFFVEGGKLLSRLIVLKFVAQDIPQQLCIAAYFYGWYAENGLRCQMCLFNPEHCDYESPLHFTNFALCVFTMLSACSNQLLVQMKPKARQFDEEEEFFQCCVRFSLLSVSTLPFSTAVVLLSGSVLHLHSAMVIMLAGIPALFGWSACLCLPMAAVCEDDF